MHQAPKVEPYDLKPCASQAIRAIFRAIIAVCQRGLILKELQCSGVDASPGADRELFSSVLVND
jgi:hypothetical protein